MLLFVRKCTNLETMYHVSPGLFPSNNTFKEIEKQVRKVQFKDFWSRLIPLFDISFWSNIGIWNIRYILGKKHISTTLQLKSPLLKIGF